MTGLFLQGVLSVWLGLACASVRPMSGYSLSFSLGTILPLRLLCLPQEDTRPLWDMYASAHKMSSEGRKKGISSFLSLLSTI